MSGGSARSIAAVSSCLRDSAMLSTLPDWCRCELSTAADLIDVLQSDLAAAIVRAEAAEAALAQAHRDFGCELRDPNGTIWDYAAKLKERAEAAEAMNHQQAKNIMEQETARRDAETRAEAVFTAGKRVTDAFRAHGEATPYTREESRTRSECESAMLALDAAIAAQQAEGEALVSAMDGKPELRIDFCD